MTAMTRTLPTNRPATITAATAGLVLLSILAVPAMILIADGFDPGFFAVGGVLATLRLIAAVGLWRGRKWGAILGFVATLLDVLLSLPGFVDGTWGDFAAMVAVYVVIGIATLVLIALPSSRRTYS